MKVLDLQCAHGHGFEGWFASNEAFERQLEGGLVECPLCADTRIVKMLSAPRLHLGNPKPPAEVRTEPSAQPSPTQTSPEARWLNAVRDVMAKTEDVGTRFADEARKMHYGEADERGIRGQATPREAQALAEEGIAVFTLPVPAALKGTLQ